MNSLPILTDLILQLGQLSGLPGLQVDDDGHAMISFNQQIVIHFQARGGDILIYSTLGPLEEGDPQGIARRLLRANFIWRSTEGATFSLAPNGDILLAHTIPAESTDFSLFQQHFTAFAKNVERWKDRLLQFKEEHDAMPLSPPDDILPHFAIPI